MNALTQFALLSASSAAIVGLVLYLLRTVISTRLKATVEHEFNSKLERLRDELQRNRDTFSAELRAKESQIQSLRETALSGVTDRQAALHARRLIAVEQLWSGVLALGPAKAAAITISVIKFEAALKEAAKNPKAREMFAMTPQFDFNKVPLDASKARPFVSEFAWALYSAYAAILGNAVVKHKMLVLGVDIAHVIDEQALKRMLITALPDMKNYFESTDSGAYYHLLDGLETKILSELRDISEGKEADANTLAKAAAITELAEKLASSNVKAANEIEKH